MFYNGKLLQVENVFIYLFIYFFTFMQKKHKDWLIGWVAPMTTNFFYLSYLFVFLNLF